MVGVIPVTGLSRITMLGDNSSESYDSRSFGYIPESSVVGKVDRVLFSIDCDQKEFCRFRFFRLFHRLH